VIEWNRFCSSQALSLAQDTYSQASWPRLNGAEWNATTPPTTPPGGKGQKTLTTPNFGPSIDNGGQAVGDADGSLSVRCLKDEVGLPIMRTNSGCHEGVFGLGYTGDDLSLKSDSFWYVVREGGREGQKEGGRGQRMEGAGREGGRKGREEARERNVGMSRVEDCSFSY
jgi:hypothetical protein